MRQEASGRRRAALAVAGFLAASVPMVTGPHRLAAQQPLTPRLALISHTAYVGTGSTWELRLRPDRSVPAGSEVAVTVFGAVETRSEFELTLTDRITSRAIGTPTVLPLPADSQDLTVRLALRDPDQPSEAGRLDLGSDDGVFPVRVELRERGGRSLERFTTHLVYMPGSHVGPKLGVALVLPFAGPIGLPADGPRQIHGLETLAASAQALEAIRALPFALAPSPETLDSLAASNEERATRTLDSLRRLAVDHTVLGSTYVPAGIPSLVASGLEGEIGEQLTRGTATVAEVLRTPRTDTRHWAATESLDAEAVDRLAGMGVERMIVPEDRLESTPDLLVTLTRPFLVQGESRRLPGVSADAGLGRHFVAEGNPVLHANHLLADLAVLWLDAPGSDRRAVVAMPPREWVPNRAFVDTLLAGLGQNPVAEPVALDAVFAVTPQVIGRGAPLVRSPRVGPAVSLGEVAPELRQARDRLRSLISVLDGPTPVSELLGERLLVAESADLRTVRQRLSYVTSVQTGVDDHLATIQLPRGRSITLTARQGEIPVTFQNRSGYPAKVVVTVQSDKLEFPEGGSRPLELTRRNTTERFRVVARTSGAFPLNITLASPDGSVVIGSTRLTVRSTAASRVSLALSSGAIAFLALWWGRHIVRGRRARRLVPA